MNNDLLELIAVPPYWVERLGSGVGSYLSAAFFACLVFFSTGADLPTPKRFCFRTFRVMESPFAAQSLPAVSIPLCGTFGGQAESGEVLTPPELF
jgi:hypothetical protein